jgi:microcystin-dependent protein
MTTTIPYRPTGGEARSISGILQNFDALITAIDNIAVGGATDLPGVIKAYAGPTAPAGYLLCDGTAVSRTTYAALFAVCGTAFGAGNGSTTFNLPDLRGRVPAGVDGAAQRLSANDALGNSGGTEKHTLAIAEMPNHFIYNNGVPILNTGIGALAAGTDRFPKVASPGGFSETTTTTAFNVTQPYQVVNYIVKT